MVANGEGKQPNLYGSTTYHHPHESIVHIQLLVFVEPTQLHMGSSPCVYLQVTINFSRPASIQRDGEAFDKNFPGKKMGSMKVPLFLWLHHCSLKMLVLVFTSLLSLPIPNNFGAFQDHTLSFMGIITTASTVWVFFGLLRGNSLTPIFVPKSITSVVRTQLCHQP